MSLECLINLSREAQCVSYELGMSATRLDIAHWLDTLGLNELAAAVLTKQYLHTNELGSHPARGQNSTDLTGGQKDD